MTSAEPVVGAAQTSAAPETRETKNATSWKTPRSRGLTASAASSPRPAGWVRAPCERSPVRPVGGAAGRVVHGRSRWPVASGHDSPQVRRGPWSQCVLDESTEQATPHGLDFGQLQPSRVTPAGRYGPSPRPGRASTSTWNWKP